AISGPADSSLTATYVNPDGTTSSIFSNCATPTATPTPTNTPVPPTATPTPTPTVGIVAVGYQVITVQKARGNRINTNTLSCNGSDDSLTGYVVTFDISSGDSPSGSPLIKLPVTLTSGSGTGSNYTDPLPYPRIYTVCEEPVATNGGQSVPLNAYPLV